MRHIMGFQILNGPNLEGVFALPTNLKMDGSPSGSRDVEAGVRFTKPQLHVHPYHRAYNRAPNDRHKQFDNGKLVDFHHEDLRDSVTIRRF